MRFATIWDSLKKAAEMVNHDYEGSGLRNFIASILDDNEVERIFNALKLRYDAKHAIVFGKYHDNEFMLDELAAGEIISEYISTECSFNGTSIDGVVESLVVNDDERNSLLSDLWEND